MRLERSGTAIGRKTRGNAYMSMTSTSSQAKSRDPGALLIGFDSASLPSE
jgi:hypothetical protein